MIRKRALLVSPRTDRAGFTLTEIVLALAVIATVFVGGLGLLPAGLTQSREAAESTVVSTILEDLNNRLRGEKLQKGVVSFNPAYFDDHGVFIPNDAAAADLARRLYRADVAVGEWSKQPAGTGSLRPLTIRLSSPVDAKGDPVGVSNPKVVVTYPVTALTGNWQAIDFSYEPKIEF